MFARRRRLAPALAEHLTKFVTYAGRHAFDSPAAARDLYLAASDLDGDLFEVVDETITAFLEYMDVRTDICVEPANPSLRAPSTAELTRGTLLRLSMALPRTMDLELEAFLADKPRRLSTCKSYRDRCGSFGRALAGGWGVESFMDVTPDQCSAYQAAALEACALPPEHPEHLSIETVKATRRHLDAFFRWAARSGELLSNPWVMVPSVEHVREMLQASGRTIPEPLPRDAPNAALRQMLAAPVSNTFEAIRNRAILGVLVDFAPRRGQLVRMGVEHVRLERDAAYILVPPDGKSRAAHLEACGLDTRKWLIRYLRVRDRAGLGIRSGPLFSDRTGKSLRPDHVTKILGRMAKRVGVASPVGPHRIRHAEVRRAKEQGQPDRDIRDRHGWSDSRMVDHYGRLYGGERVKRDAERSYADELLTIAEETAPALRPRAPHSLRRR